jgi:hypothetical protein
VPGARANFHASDFSIAFPALLTAVFLLVPGHWTPARDSGNSRP